MLNKVLLRIKQNKNRAGVSIRITQIKKGAIIRPSKKDSARDLSHKAEFVGPKGHVKILLGAIFIR